MKNTEIFKVLKQVLSRPIAFHRIFASVGGGATEGLFLSQAYYWSQHTKDPDGWFYKTFDEWFDETALTRREQETARRALKQLNILEEKRKGVPARLYFRVNSDRLYQAVYDLSVQSVQSATSGKLENKSATNGNPECQNLQTGLSDVADKNVQSDKQSIYTEITTETTTKSAPESAHPHPRACVEISSQESAAIPMNHLPDDSLVLNSTNPSNFDQQDQLNTPLDNLSSDIKSTGFIGQKNNIFHENKSTRRENDSYPAKSVKTDEYWLERIDALEEDLQEYCDHVQGRLTSKGINRCSSSSDPWMKGANVRMEIVEFVVTMKERELIGKKTTYQPTMPNIRSEIKNDYERGRDYYAAYIKSLHFKNLNQVQQQQPKPMPVVDTASAIADYEKISKSEHFEVLGRAFMDYRRMDAFLLEHPHRKPWVEWMIAVYQDQMKDHHKKFLGLTPTEPPKEMKPGFEKFSTIRDR